MPVEQYIERCLHVEGRRGCALTAGHSGAHALMVPLPEQTDALDGLMAELDARWSAPVHGGIPLPNINHQVDVSTEARRKRAEAEAARDAPPAAEVERKKQKVKSKHKKKKGKR